MKGMLSILFSDYQLSLNVLNSQRVTRNPERATRNPKPGTRNPERLDNTTGIRYLYVCMVGDVVDKLYKLKHPRSALMSMRHRMSRCPTVLLFQLTTRHIR